MAFHLITLFCFNNVNVVSFSRFAFANNLNAADTAQSLTDMGRVLSSCCGYVACNIITYYTVFFSFNWLKDTVSMVPF